MSAQAVQPVAVLGVGMHPWGKWGRNFVEYGLAAARQALDDAGLDWRDVQLVSGAETIRNGYPGFVAGATFAQALGWSGARVASSYAEAGIGPEDLDLAEVYDLSSALELDWYENIGLCAEGEAERLIRDGDTAVGGRIPVNPSGGLACFGEAIPAQAIAQVCELAWQLRGAAEQRQVEGARVGVTANQGLFGHGSAVVVAR